MGKIVSTDVPSDGTRAGWHLRSLGVRLVSPKWRWFTVTVLVACSITLRLAIWQFDRLAQRMSADAVQTVAYREPPIALDTASVFKSITALDSTGLSSMTYRRVLARGTYDHSNDEALTTQVLDGQVGVHLLTPLKLSGQDAAILVDRGWLPIDFDRPVRWQPFQTSGEVSVEGRLRTGFRRIPGTTGLVLSGEPLSPDLDLDRISMRLPYPLLRLVLTEASEAPGQVGSENQLPMRRDFQEPSTDIPHLFYAFQWIGITLIAGGGYISLVAQEFSAANRQVGPRAFRARATAR